ncbi:MAG: hydroxymethylbilane synthase [Deinococcota bacterium]
MTKTSFKTPQKILRIATRTSDLALWQARWLAAQLHKHDIATDLVHVETQGDVSRLPFKDMQGQGFFTKAVQDVVLAGEADVAVHSHKDLPSAPHPELELAALSERADARDVLLVSPDAWENVSSTNSALPLRAGAKVGTSAVRRQRQLESLRPDLVVAELRGNVPTRIEKLRARDYDAIVLAAAGVARLELDLRDLRTYYLEPHVMIPAPAQGVLAFECRRDAYEVASLLTEVHDKISHRCVAAERGLMAMLQGGCQLALGAHATWDGTDLTMHCWYEGDYQTVQHRSPEGAAFLAYEALGRPAPAQ